MLKSKLEFFGKGGDVSTGKAFTKISYQGLVQVGSRDSLGRELRGQALVRLGSPSLSSLCGSVSVS